MKLHKLFTEILFQMDCPSFFKESLVKDFSDLEGKLRHIEIMYGIRLKVESEEIEKPEGRWLGQGIIEDMSSIADLYKKPKCK